MTEPAQGIMKLNDCGESKWYYITCDCTDPDHAHTVEVEADDHSVCVHIHTTVKTRFWEKRRWRQLWNMFTRGYAEYEATAILNEQQAINYSNALTSAVEDVKVFRKQMMYKRNNDKAIND
jgi:hypothetical protein